MDSGTRRAGYRKVPDVGCESAGGAFSAAAADKPGRGSEAGETLGRGRAAAAGGPGAPSGGFLVEPRPGLGAPEAGSRAGARGSRLPEGRRGTAPRKRGRP